MKTMTKLKLNLLILSLLLIILCAPLEPLLSSPVEMSLREAVHRGLEHNLEVILARLHMVETAKKNELAVAAGDEELIERMAKEVEQGEESLINAKKQLILAVEASYFRILQDEDQLEVQREALHRNAVQLEADELRFQAGEISLRDIAMSRNNYRDVRKAYEEAQEEMALKRMEFNYLLGQAMDKPFQLKRSESFEELQIDPHEAYELALANREDMIKAREAIKEAEEQLKKMDNPFHAPVLIAEARNQLLREKIVFEQLKNSLFFEIQRACQSLFKAYEDIEKAEEDLEMKEKELLSQTLQYDAGLISTQQMMEAQLELARAENRVIQAKWSYNSARLDFERNLGLWSIEEYLEGMDFQLKIPEHLLHGEVEE